MVSTNQRESLAAELDRHVEEEDAILKQYRTLSDQLTEGPLSVLINQIATEEEMHHFLLRTLAEWLRRPPARGESLSELGLNRDAILRDTRMLRGHEKRTIQSCRALKAELSGEDRDLFEALLDAIALDSEKHDRLLETVEKQIR